jgi:hypothetical protein
MRRTPRLHLLAVILGGCGALGLALPAVAQQSTPLKEIPPQVLDQMSQDHPPQDFGTPPPASSIPQTQAFPVPGLWVCKSTDHYEPIHAQPDASSPVIATTHDWGAVTGAYESGFQEVLVHKGMTGYLAAQYIHPFHDQVDPSATCTFEGVQANGLPLLDVK